MPNYIAPLKEFGQGVEHNRIYGFSWPGTFRFDVPNAAMVYEMDHDGIIVGARMSADAPGNQTLYGDVYLNGGTIYAGDPLPRLTSGGTSDDLYAPTIAYATFTAGDMLEALIGVTYTGTIAPTGLNLTVYTKRL